MKHDALNGGYCSCGVFHEPNHTFVPSMPSCVECGLGMRAHPILVGTQNSPISVNPPISPQLSAEGVPLNTGQGNCTVTWEEVAELEGPEAYECDGTNCPERPHDHYPY